jgi:hypothetical protein
MNLSGDEQAFLHQRRRLLSSWRYVGPLLLIVIVALSVWLVVATPWLANPLYVVTQLQSGKLPQTTIALMAGMLPIAVLAVLLLCTVNVLFAYSAFASERKYLLLLDRYSGA